MGGKRWTEEEIQYIDENRGKISCQEMSDELGRSKDSVYSIMWKRKMRGFRTSSIGICVSKLYTDVGISEYRLRHTWKMNGLKMHRVGRSLIIMPDDLIEYMRTHPDEWNARSIKDDTMFREYDWFREKRMTDPEPKYRWTHEDRTLIASEYRKGTPISEIAKMLSRSKGSVIGEANRLRDKGWDIPYAYNPVREREDALKRKLLALT
jgi:transposase